MMTSRFGLPMLLSIFCLLLLARYLIGLSHLDLMPRTFSLQTSPPDPSQMQPGVTINLPPVVAPVDDGERFYYVQANLAVEIDRPSTGTVVRDRHETIDRYIMEMLHSYPIQDLRALGHSVTLRDDLKRTVNSVLPKGQIRNVYITSLPLETHQKLLPPNEAPV